MAALARERVFSQGYITQRAGVYTAGERGSGMAQAEKIFPRFVKPAGYTSDA